MSSPIHENPPDQLKQAVESEHGGTATFLQSVPIHESLGGRTVWNGAVQVYELAGSPSGATRAYAWSSTVEGSTKRRFFAMLHAGPVTSPREAVRAILLAEHKAK
jgi:hypothetical protein